MYGDCIRACVATLIDRDDVPHLFDGRPFEDAWKAMREYLTLQGKFIALFAEEDHAELMTENNPGVPYILFHATSQGNHVVICEDGKVVHDPAWYKMQITGPAKIPQPDGSIEQIYVIGIIGNIP
jgi:2-phosphoglycerate kinase